MTTKFVVMDGKKFVARYGGVTADWVEAAMFVSQPAAEMFIFDSAKYGLACTSGWQICEVTLEFV